MMLQMFVGVFNLSELSWLGKNIINEKIKYEKQKQKFSPAHFQFKKHLSLGRGGAILTDNEESAEILRKMVYDGRLRDTPWAEQNIDMLGYHYYMTPETAELGLSKLGTAINTAPRIWTWEDYPDLRTMKVFDAITSK